MKARFLHWLFLVFVSGALPAFAQTNVSELNLPLYIVGVLTYQPGQSLQPYRDLEELVRQSLNKPSLRKLLEIQLGKMVASVVAPLETRRFACQQLAIIGGDRALPDIARLLRKDETAGFACLALSTYPEGAADEVLREALASARGTAQIQIINTLGNRRNAAAVNALATLARGTDSAAAEAAILALGKIGNAPAREALATLFKGDAGVDRAWAETRLPVASQLAEAGDRSAMAMFEELLASSQPVYVRRGAFAGLLKLDEQNAETRILNTLHGTDEVLKPVAIAAIRDLPSKGVSEKFGAELPSLPVEQQVWLIESLTVRNDSAARTALIATLGSSGDSTVRQAASQALGRLGDSAFARPLALALAAAKNDDEARIIESALAALQNGRETEEAVLAEMKLARDQTRARLISSLAARRSPEVITALIAETENPDAQPAKAAFRVLSRAATAENLEVLLGKFARLRNLALQADVGTYAEQAVLQVDSPSARSEAVRSVLRQSFQTSSRSALVRLLPACGDANALAVLKLCLDEPVPEVQDAAVHALADWPDAQAWEPLLATFRRPRRPAHRDPALRGLVRLIGEQNARPDEKLVANYRQLLKDARGQNELKLVLGALGGAAHPEALKLALPIATDRSVRPEAEAAVKRIAEAIKAKYPNEAQAALDELARLN